MERLDCRRLTGPNLFWDKPSVVVDVSCSASEVDGLELRWRDAVCRMHERIGWPTPEFVSRRLEGGVSLAFDAPIDRLYSAVEIGEWAWADANGEQPDLYEGASLIFAQSLTEQNPKLIAVQRAAAQHGVPFLWDDDFVSVGLGKHARQWPVREMCWPEAVKWEQHGRVPVGLVTGTNGKTTTARIAAQILRKAGLVVGLTSTEGVLVDDEDLDRGDYSGPGGARMVLRDTRVDAAILETARGGLLRRGLGVEQADAAVITNIAADHLGDYGSRTLEELLEIKWMVSRAVVESGVLVLNADDPMLVERARDYRGATLWFSMYADKDADWWLEDGALHCRDGRVCDAADIPITLDGKAKHNIANALAAGAFCEALGVDLATICAGLTSMEVADNPGRTNVYRIGEVDVLVDFAHNPHAMRAIVDMAVSMPARRRLLAFSQPGDRPDTLIREIVQVGWSMQPDRVIFSELAQYARGRAPGELFAIVHDELLGHGCIEANLVHVQTEVEALRDALAWAQPGDQLLLIVLGENQGVTEELERILALSGEA